MINVTCPWCDGPMAVEDDRPDLDCPDCSIVVEFAPDPRVEFAAAA
jgi:primosomal protein N'